MRIISDRNALKALSPYVGTLSEIHRDRATLYQRAHQIMSHHPVVIDQSCSEQEAAQLMIFRGISCLPVTTSDGAVQGVVTSKDLLTAFWTFTTS